MRREGSRSLTITASRRWCAVARTALTESSYTRWVLPPEVRRLLWDVDPEAVDLVAHRDFVIERVMSRGSLAAMRWLRAAFALDVLAGFLSRKAHRLSARDRAYWRLVCGLPEEDQAPGGGRPAWVG